MFGRSTSGKQKGHSEDQRIIRSRLDGHEYLERAKDDLVGEEDDGADEDDEECCARECDQRVRARKRKSERYGREEWRTDGPVSCSYVTDEFGDTMALPSRGLHRVTFRLERYQTRNVLTRRPIPPVPSR